MRQRHVAGAAFGEVTDVVEVGADGIGVLDSDHGDFLAAGIDASDTTLVAKLDAGGAWRKIETFDGVPDQTYVSRLEASRHDVEDRIPGTHHATDRVHLRVDYTPLSDRWGLALTGENIFDETYFLNITNPLGTPLGIPAFEGLYRLEFRLNF